MKDLGFWGFMLVLVLGAGLFGYCFGVAASDAGSREIYNQAYKSGELFGRAEAWGAGYVQGMKDGERMNEGRAEQ